MIKKHKSLNPELDGQTVIKFFGKLPKASKIALAQEVVADSEFYDPFVGNTKASKTILSQDGAWSGIADSLQ